MQDEEKNKRKSARKKKPRRRARESDGVDADSFEPSFEAPPTPNRSTSRPSNDASAKSRSRRTVPATAPGNVSVDSSIESPAAPNRSVSTMSSGSKSRRVARATTPGAVAVDASIEPPPPPGPNRSVSSMSSSSKSRRVARATTPGAVIVDSSVEPNSEHSERRQRLERKKSKNRSGSSQRKGKTRSSARATTPGAVAVDATETSGSQITSSGVANLDPDAVKTLTEVMGFPLLHAQKGLLNGGGTVEGAVEWIYDHQNDADINDPIADVSAQEPDGVVTSGRSLDASPGAYAVKTPASSAKNSLRKSGPVVAGADIAALGDEPLPRMSSSKRSSRRMQRAAVPGAVAVAGAPSASGKSKRADIAGLQGPSSRGSRYMDRSSRGMSYKSTGSGGSGSSRPGVQEVHGDSGGAKSDSKRPRVLDAHEEAGEDVENRPGARQVREPASDKSAKLPRVLDAEDDSEEEAPGALRVRQPASGKSAKDAGPTLVFGEDGSDDEEDDLERNAESSNGTAGGKGPRPVASMGVAVGSAASENRSRQVASMGVAVGRGNDVSQNPMSPSQSMLNAPVQLLDDWNANLDDRKDAEDSKRKCRICCIAVVALIVVVVAVVVGVTVGGGGGSGGDGSTGPASTVVPTAAPTVDFSVCFEAEESLESFSLRYESIRDVIMGVSTGNVDQIDVPNTPQRKALCWVADFDGLQVSVAAGDTAALLQRYTIAVFYYALVDDSAFGGLADTNWLSAVHECSWQGVACVQTAELDVVSELFVDNLALNGTIPDEIGDFNNLELFSVAINENVIGSLPASLWNIVSLTTILFDNTELTGELPSEIGNLSNLLSIAGSRLISGPIPEELSLLTNLVNCTFRSGLTGTIPTSMGLLTALELLLLSFNKLTGGIPSEVGQFQSLRFLELSANEFTGFRIPSELGRLRNLEFLELSRCQLGGTLPSELGNLGKLVTMTVIDNSLTGTIPTEFGNLKSAESLRFFSTQLTGTMPSQVCDLRQGNLSELTADCKLNEVVCEVRNRECCTECF